MHKSAMRFGPRSAAIALTLLVVAACGSSSTSSGSSGNPFDPTNFNEQSVSWLTGNVNATGSPVTGGTLQIEGSTDFSQLLDPQGEYEADGYTVLRAFARQLVTYKSSSDETVAETLTPDVASAMPTVSSDGKTYTFHLQNGVMWNTPTPRAVTSKDFVLGLKRICDPSLASQGNPSYYSKTIVGFEDFCTPFTSQDPSESASARAAYINGNNISGIKTPDDSTLVITLTQPASDFLNIMAMPFASAAPVENLQYVPMTPGNPLYSDGPYQVSKYDVGHEVDLDHNPQWKASTDKVRHQYVDSIHIKLDLSGASADSQVQQDMQAGTADLSLNTVVPASEISNLTSPSWNPQYGAFPSPGVTNPYVVFNTQSSNNNGALGNVKVRQALEYAVDKVAIGKIYGGTALNQPLNQVFGPGAEGYVPFNDYPTPNNQGDPAKCKQMLADAGVSNLTIKDDYRDNGKHPAVFQEIQSDFAKCGVTVKGNPISSGYYGSSGIGVTVASDLKKGNWDITEPGWNPDWYGPTNARSILPPLFGTSNFPGSNWGGYSNPAVDDLVNQALAAPTLSQASDLWHQADQKVMADAAFIPLQTQLTALFHSKHVHNALYSPFATAYDITQIWLS